MKAAGTRAAGRRAGGAHARDLRPARQAADRLGQRPADDRPQRAAVDVVARSAVLWHVAGAAARPLARVCSAPQRRARAIARARVRIGRTRTEQARRAGAVGRAAPLPRADRDRVHLACKSQEPTSAADASGGYSGRRNIPRSLYYIVSMKISPCSCSIRVAPAEKRGRQRAMAGACVCV